MSVHCTLTNEWHKGQKPGLYVGAVDKLDRAMAFSDDVGVHAVGSSPPPVPYY